MKKLLLIVLALLMLSGCGNTEETQPTETTEPAPTGLYDPDSAIEAETGGAVRAYPLEDDGDYLDLAAMGSKLLLQGANEVTVLQGELCEPGVTIDTEEALMWDERNTCDANAQGFAYYASDSREVILLNPQLQEISRIQLPEELQNAPAISLDSNCIYYFVPGELRALDMETGISRLIRSHSYENAYLSGVYFGGEVLRCYFYNYSNDIGYSEYISAENGQTLWTGSTGLLYTNSDSYYLSRRDGSVRQKIVGQRDGEAKLLTITDENVADAMSLGGVVGYTLDTEGLQMALYDIESGKCTSLVYMDGIRTVTHIAASDKYVWILVEDKDYYHEPAIYRWDVSKTPVNEKVVYTDTLYTAENPDTEGLAVCQERVDAMNKQYGVRIRIWQDAVKDPGEYTLVPEYQVQTINEMLDSLEPALARFPEGFLRKTVESGWIYIDLVRSIDSTAWGAKQHWVDGDCHIVLTVNTVLYEAAATGDCFLKTVGYAIDSHVLGNSRDYDDWDALNPEGFQYTDDPTVVDSQAYWEAYMEPEDSAFLESMSMYSPAQDRAILFYHAMRVDDNSFTNAPLQQKLKRMCEGIREAYGLEKSDETYPWEQHLTLELDYNNIR